MNWGKAGRPKSKEKEKPEQAKQDNSKWTKEELSIVSATENSALTLLGIAVVKQWINDGKPRTEFDGIRPWLDIIRDSLKEKDSKLNLPTLPKDN